MKRKSVKNVYQRDIGVNEYPEEIYVARKDSPMILGVEDGESYIASDVPAILKYTRNVYYIGNMEMARVRKGEITFYNLDGDEIEKELKTIDWNAEAAEKAGYEHFMMKEIHEQPKVVGDTINSVVKEDFIDLSNVGLSEEDIKEISQIYHGCRSRFPIRRRNQTTCSGWLKWRNHHGLFYP